MSTVVQVTGGSVAEIIASLGGVAGVSLHTFSTEELLAELRERMVKQTPAMVVKVEPFEAAAGDDAKPATTTTTKDKKPRGKAAEKNAPTPPTTTAPPLATEAGTQAEGGDEWSEDNDDAGTTAAGSVPSIADTSKVTMDDVRAALDAVKNKCGLVTARGIMAEVAGSSKLVDIPANKYPALVAALNKANKDATKAAA